MKATTILLMMSAVLALSGCATGMSEQDCLAADWRTVGFEDGVAGRHASAIGNYRNQCAEAGVTPDLDAYLQGREEGLVTYCQPSNGYRLGERGAQYQGVCDPAIEADFLASYEAGRELYLLRSDVNRLERQLRNAEEQLVALEVEIQTITLEVIQDGLTPEQRLALLADAKAAEARKEIVEADIITLREELALSRERLQFYAAR